MTALAARSRWPIQPLAATLFAASAAFFLLFGLSPVHAQNKAVGTVVVEPGEVAEDGVSTGVGNIEVLGEVEGDVHTAKGNIVVRGPVDGDIRSGVGNVEVVAPVDGKVEAGFGNVFIDSEVDGNVAVERGNVELGPSAVVEGKVFHGSGQFIAAPSARFDGTMAGMASDFDGDDESEILGFLGWVFLAALFGAATVLVSVVMPRPLGASSRMVGESPFWSLAAGVGSVVAAIVLFTVLLVSGIGIPILILLAPAYLVFVAFGAMVFAYFVGRKVAMATGGHRSGNFFAAFVGAVLLAAVYFLPFGLFFFGLLALLGAGAALMAILARRRPNRV